MEWCVNCGKSRLDTALIRIPSYAPELGACAPCIDKFGLLTLAHEADLWLAEHFSDEAHALAEETEVFMDMMGCLHCGNPVMKNPDGSRPLWCMTCHKGLEKARPKP